PVSTTHPAVPGSRVMRVRSRRRTSLRVSQPLRPPSTSTASLQAWPNCARSYPVFGARPLTGIVPSAASAGEEAPAPSAVELAAGSRAMEAAVSVTVTGDGVMVSAGAVAVAVAVIVVVVVEAAVGSPGVVHAAPRVLTTRSAIVPRNRVVMAEP